MGCDGYRLKKQKKNNRMEQNRTARGEFKRIAKSRIKEIEQNGIEKYTRIEWERNLSNKEKRKWNN